MGLELILRTSQPHRLLHKQNLQLKNLLQLSQKLKHPDIPDVIQGIDGMRLADKILKERDSSGLLIGGLPERIWNYRTKPEDLYKSKDVDVLVLNDEFKLEKNFEGGIDWWLPKYSNIKIISDASEYTKNQKYYENGNDVFLYFSIDKYSELLPGLYIPSKDLIINIKIAETVASISRKTFVETDDEVFNKLKKTFEKRLGTKVAGFFAKEFKENILDFDYCDSYTKSNSLGLEEFDNEIIIGINRSKTI